MLVREGRKYGRSRHGERSGETWGWCSSTRHGGCRGTRIEDHHSDVSTPRLLPNNLSCVFHCYVLGGGQITLPVLSSRDPFDLKSPNGKCET